MAFLRNLLASLLALVLFTLGLLFVIGSLVSAEQLTDVKNNSILHIRFNKPITERQMENPFEEFGFAPGPASSIGLRELRGTLEHAANDEKIKGVLIEMDGMAAGMASLQEIRDMITEFKASGKFVSVYAQYYGEGGYYLATAADEILLHPEGDLEFNGLSSGVVFLKGMFDKIGVEPQIFRVGDFKSAVEPFIREDMSPESEQQMKEMVENLSEHMLQAVASARSLDLEKVRNINDSMLVRNPALALEYGLVDQLAYDDEMRSHLNEKTEGDDLHLISYDSYRNSYIEPAGGKNRIAVVVASGDIVGGAGGWEMVGDAKFVKTLREIRENDNIMAVVLRVNSPGGSALASDAIWREVKLLSEVKPVIASMSDIAASGGYYIAMAADTIVAQPNTITGSIGIFSIIFNAQELLNDKLGITTDGVKTGMYADLYTSDRPLTDQEKNIIQAEVNKKYDTFVRKAAEGRGMEDDAIRAVASGRVWTGDQALRHGLVDVLGGFDTAIGIAAEKAGISDDYRLRYYPPQQSFMDVLLGNEDMSEQILAEELGQLYPFIREVKQLERLKGTQARLPYVLEIH